MAVDTNNFALSFSHAILKIQDTQYTAISNVSFSQDVERSAVYGTARSPLKRSIGQLSLGEGRLTFSDLQEGMSFYAGLGSNPSAATFAVDATFSNEDGSIVQSFELQGCSLSGFSGDFEQGADALQLEISFDFMRLLVNGAEFSTS
jgi:hypothetical protein